MQGERHDLTPTPQLGIPNELRAVAEHILNLFLLSLHRLDDAGACPATMGVRASNPAGCKQFSRAFRPKRAPISPGIPARRRRSRSRGIADRSSRNQVRRPTPTKPFVRGAARRTKCAAEKERHRVEGRALSVDTGTNRFNVLGNKSCVYPWSSPHPSRRAINAGKSRNDRSRRHLASRSPSRAISMMRFAINSRALSAL